MADENTAAVPQPSHDQDGRTRRIETGRSGAGREGGGPRERDSGGFRIRLSDNELRAARAVQDAFQLRSTVAALGFSIRTLAQLLEQGQLDALIAEHRAQGGAPRHDGPPREGQRTRRPPGEGRGERRGSRPDPFARPSRPQAPAEVAPADAGAASSGGDLTTEPEASEATGTLAVVISEPEAAVSQPAAEALATEAAVTEAPAVEAPAAVETAEIQP
jgi:hypothetical protein